MNGLLPPISSPTGFMLLSPEYLQEIAADLGRAGEGDDVDVRVAADRLAGGLAEAGHDVEHAGGTPASIASSARRSAVSGVCSAGLTHRRAAGGERRRELPGGHQQREVPRQHQAGHAAGSLTIMRDALSRRVGATLPKVLSISSAYHWKKFGTSLPISCRQSRDRLAAVDALEHRELLLMLADQRRELQQHRLALLGRGAAPGPRVERAAGSPDGGVDVLGPCNGRPRRSPVRSPD